MPDSLPGLCHVGTAPMTWVGGSIIAHGLYEFGISGPEHVIEAAAHWAEQAFPAIAGLAGWLATALVDFIIGLALGALLIPVAGYAISPAWGAVKRLVPKRA
jgi:predicted DNA repair protein MutK